MKYIYENIEGAICFDSYFKHIQMIKNDLPEHVFEFASDHDRYSLDSNKSLHDAWLISLLIKEPSKGERGELRKNEIELELLGPYHDRVHLIRYMNVSSFVVESVDSQNGYGDLLFHEVTFDGENIVHEIIFSSKARIVIKCKDFAHSEQLIHRP